MCGCGYKSHDDHVIGCMCTCVTRCRYIKIHTHYNVLMFLQSTLSTNLVSGPQATKPSTTPKQPLQKKPSAASILSSLTSVTTHTTSIQHQPPATPPNTLPPAKRTSPSSPQHELTSPMDTTAPKKVAIPSSNTSFALFRKQALEKTERVYIQMFCFMFNYNGVLSLYIGVFVCRRERQRSKKNRESFRGNRQNSRYSERKRKRLGMSKLKRMLLEDSLQSCCYVFVCAGSVVNRPVWRRKVR